MVRGAIGAVVLADTRRLDDGFASVDFFDVRGVPYLVAVNAIDGAPAYSEADLRAAIDLAPHILLLQLEARESGSSTLALITLLQYRLSRPVIA